MSKIRWMSQSTGINLSQFEDSMKSLMNLKYDVKDFGVIPFTKQITNLENILEKDYHYIIRGGTKMLSILDDIKSIADVNDNLSKEQIDLSDQFIDRLRAGIFWDEAKFDQQNYGLLDLPLLNADAKYIPIKDNLNLKFDEPMFIKPSSDQKAFNAGILDVGVTVDEFIKSQQFNPRYIEEHLVVSSPKNVINEYRFIILNGRVIGASSYRLNRQLNKNGFISNDLVAAAEFYATLYQPHDIFTLDLCTVDGSNEFYIVEYNCFNASGLYSINKEFMFKEIHEYVKCKID